MKILFVNNFFSSRGSAGKLVLSQAGLLKEKGHETAFFATNKRPFAYEPYIYEQFFPEYLEFKDRNSLDAIINPGRFFFNIEAKEKLSEMISHVRPDIVHCHNIYHHLTPSVIAACKELNVPVVMTLHDSRLICPVGTMMFRAQEYCRREFCVKGNPLFGLINRCRDSSLYLSMVSTREFSFNRKSGLFDYVSLFICPSKAAFNLAGKSGISGRRLEVLNYFIEDNLLEQSPTFSNRGYFLYFGSLVKEKGLHLLIEAAKLLPKNIKFHIVGEGPESEYLSGQAERLGLSNIKFRGYLDNEDLKEEIAGCVAAVFPCNSFETVGLTIAESFAQGKPVIAGKIGAARELISNYQNGVLFESGSVEQLCQAVYWIYTQRDAAVEMGKRAHAKAQLLFNSKFHYKKLIKIYEFVLNKSYNSLKSGLN